MRMGQWSGAPTVVHEGQGAISKFCPLWGWCQSVMPLLINEACMMSSVQCTIDARSICGIGVGASGILSRRSGSPMVLLFMVIVVGYLPRVLSICAPLDGWFGIIAYRFEGTTVRRFMLALSCRILVRTFRFESSKNCPWNNC